MAWRLRPKRKIRSPSPSSPKLPVLNTTGFAALPYELYLEIMSYWPPLPVPTEELTNYDNLDLRARRFTMLSLSQTCSSLRRVFQALLWERIEVYDGMVTHDGALPFFNPGSGRIKLAVHKMYADETVRQLETVTIRNPSLARYVHTLNLLVTDFSVKWYSKSWNLHTVQLDFSFDPEKENVENAFADDKYA